MSNRNILSGALIALALTTPAAFAADKPSWGAADDASFAEMLKTGFREKGIAKLSRLEQDPVQALCSDPERAYSPEMAKQREKIEADNMAAIKWPSDGKWLGDWKKGEAVAQSGRGLTSSDKADVVNGGNCYNCHQLSPTEISFGTIGPSLLHYGKLRGNDAETLRYTWGRIYNAKAYNACSNMPRAGHMGILNENQIRDLMALLLDPESPVNK